jgi:hypothetical protein
MAHANNSLERARVARAAHPARSPAMREVSLFEDLGFVEIPNALTAGQCADLANSVDDTDGGRAGSRNLLELPCCIGLRGGVLVMRPLLLHSSSKTRVQSRRRVLHFLFGPSELTCGLRWHRAV